MKIRTIICVMGIAGILTACGGGSSSSATDPTSTDPSIVTLSGTAATGMAIPSAIVEAKCMSGNGTATTSSDGNYSMTISGGSLPCTLRVTIPNSSEKLHSVAFGSGNVAVSNITPLTELMVARMTRTDPAAFFREFGTAAASVNVSSTQVADSQTDVATVLSSIGDMANIGNFVTATLKAATATTSSDDAQDKLLDELNIRLTSAQFSEVRTALASSASTAQVAHLFADLARAAVTEVPVAFMEIAWDPFGFSRDQTMVITDASTWESIQAQQMTSGSQTTLPAIDFSRQMVFGIVKRIVLAGEIVKIVRVYRIGEKLFVEYGITNHTSRPITAYRAQFAIIEKLKYPIEFISVTIPWTP